MRNKLRRFLKTKDAKTLVENFLSLSALQLIGIVLPLITLPYIIRTVGFDKYGVIVFASSLIAYFTSLTDFSFKITAVRDVAIFKNSPKKLNLIYSKVLIIRCFFLLLSLLIIGLIVVLVPSFYEYKDIYFYSSLLLVGYAMFPEWFFQGIEKMKYITYLNVGVKLFFTVFVFILIKTKDDYWIYPLLNSAGFIGAGIIGQYMLNAKYKLKFIWVSNRIIKRTIKSNLPIFINQFVPTLYNNSSTFLLGFLGTKSVVGIYQAIQTVVNVGITVIEILSRVFFPFLNRKKDTFKSYKMMMLSVVSIMTIILGVSYKLIFLYLNIIDSNSVWIYFILLLGLYGYALSNIFGLNYFIVRRKDKLVMQNTIIGSVIGFVLAFPMIINFGAIGAALNLSLSRWIIGGRLYLKYKKIKYENSDS